MDADYSHALSYAEESLALFTELGDRARTGWQRVNIAFYKMLRRKYGEAITELRGAYELLRDDPHPWYLASYLDTCFVLTCELNRDESAGKILGFVEKYRLDHRVPRLPFRMPLYAPQYEKLLTRAGEQRVWEWRAIGEHLSLSEIEDLMEEVVVP